MVLIIKIIILVIYLRTCLFVIKFNKIKNKYYKLLIIILTVRIKICSNIIKNLYCIIL
jgi:hypothetical protein